MSALLRPGGQECGRSIEEVGMHLVTPQVCQGKVGLKLIKQITKHGDICKILQMLL